MKDLQKGVLDSLKGAHSKETVADVFKANDVQSQTKKTAYLDMAQGATKVYSTPGMSDEDRYEMALEAFLDPIWREMSKDRRDRT